MLPRAHRLRLSAEIRQVRRRGHRRSHPLLLLFADEKKQGATRFAIAVSGRLGHAVARNRAKRRIREAIRRQLPGVRSGWDCLFVAREGITEASLSDVEEAVQHLLARCGILDGRRTD